MEKWVLLAKWIIHGLRARDEKLLGSVRESIQTDWLEKFWELNECLDNRDDICKNAFGKICVSLSDTKSILEANNKYPDAGTFLDAVNDSFSEPFEQIQRLLEVASIRLNGENGVGHAVNKIKNEMEVWVQKGKQAVDYKNILIRNKRLDIINTPSTSPITEVEAILGQVFRALEFDIEPLRVNLNDWYLLSQMALKNVGSTERYSSSAGISTRNINYQKTGSIYANVMKNVVSPIDTNNVGAISESNWDKEEISYKEDWSLCQTYLLLWLTHMEKSIETTWTRRLDEVNAVEQELVAELIEVTSPRSDNPSQRKSIPKVENDRDHSYQKKSTDSCSIITDRLIQSLAQIIENRRGFQDKSSALRYLQSADQTVRERSVTNPSDGGPFMCIPLELGVQLSSNIPQTSMAYAGMQELEKNGIQQVDYEAMACDAEESALREQKNLYMEVARTKELREQIQAKRAIVNQVKRLKNDAAFALDEVSDT
ncbi:hypothetical protein FBUS_07050 [Fasciolopsis buskii]|uniref:Uncharacterized protein n=1 Tax=Fasciolopsis buskii TaxID=27845 RepID=A0A8E0RUX3_9TREM|nr:hypothetical protein FBUS_07050 [Fasciolopsis buski]